MYVFVCVCVCVCVTFVYMCGFMLHQSFNSPCASVGSQLQLFPSGNMGIYSNWNKSLYKLKLIPA